MEFTSWGQREWNGNNLNNQRPKQPYCTCEETSSQYVYGALQLITTPFFPCYLKRIRCFCVVRFHVCKTCLASYLSIKFHKLARYQTVKKYCRLDLTLCERAYNTVHRKIESFIQLWYSTPYIYYTSFIISRYIINFESKVLRARWFVEY